jgi:hypothetical protein
MKHNSEIYFECALHLQGRSAEAVRALSITVHRHPGQPSLWLALALLLLHLYSEHKSSGAARCAQVAMALGRGMMDVSKVNLLSCIPLRIIHQLMNIYITVQVCDPSSLNKRLNIHFICEI